jgi:hypothetical protein
MNKKLIALIVSGLLVIALIIYFIFIYDFNKSTNPDDQPQKPVEAIAVVKDDPKIITPARTAEEQARDQATQLALSFTERYGSSSTQSDFSNLSDLEVFMTEEMQLRTQQFVKTEQAKSSTNLDYSGVTTKAIVAKFNSFEATTASAVVSTKRQEEDTNGDINSYNQNLLLTMKKIDGEWKVDSAVWQE